MTPRAAGLALACLSTLAACGTTYAVPVAAPADLARARAMFAEEAAFAARPGGDGMTVAEFRAVVARVEPVAEAFCRQQTADIPGFDCDVTIRLDTSTSVRNASQFYEAGRPVVAVTLPFIAEARAPDELAFVLGHEFGHHIGRHIEKQQQQAVAGALILGALTAYGQAAATQSNPTRYTGGDRRQMDTMVQGGMGLGQAAYSQTYELESDVIGTYIATAAGYDPVEGARFFARPEQPRSRNGELSFWGTHPADETRLATVLATTTGMAGPTQAPVAE